MKVKINTSKLLNKIALFLHYWKNRTTRKQFILFLSISVGLSVGLVAVILKASVHQLYSIVVQNRFTDNYYFSLLFPITGIALTYLIIRKILDGKLTKGLASLHFNIAQQSSIIPSNQMYAQLITSPVTVGLGGSAGLEAPIVITGAAFGSNYAQYFHLNYSERTLLLACGVAAGIGSAFNAPIAGVVFTLEVLMLEIGTTGFVPLLISAATGALVSKIILKEGTLLSFQLQQPFNYNNVPFYVILGVLAGLLSVYHARMFVKVERYFSSFGSKPFWRILYSGALLALLILFFPSLFGEGYNSIKSLALMQTDDLFRNSLLLSFLTNEWIILFFIGFVMFLKAIATGITLGGGGNGGNFAPSLFVGSYLGFFYSRLINQSGISYVPESNFTIVGMAGLLSGLYHAPLTAIFLIAEITGGYSLMIPLIIVSSLSYFVSKSIEPYTIDTKQFAETKKIFSGNKDANILVTMKIETLIESDFMVLHDSDKIEHLIHAIIASQRNIFPVVNKDNELQGIILLSEVKNLILDREKNNQIQVRDLMKPPFDVINITDSITSVVEKFDATQAWNLPVVDNNQYIGFISKSKLFSSYRSELIKRTIE